MLPEARPPCLGRALVVVVQVPAAVQGPRGGDLQAVAACCAAAEKPAKEADLAFRPVLEQLTAAAQ